MRIRNGEKAYILTTSQGTYISDDRMELMDEMLQDFAQTDTWNFFNVLGNFFTDEQYDHFVELMNDKSDHQVKEINLIEKGK